MQGCAPVSYWVASQSWVSDLATQLTSHSTHPLLTNFESFLIKSQVILRNESKKMHFGFSLASWNKPTLLPHHVCCCRQPEYWLPDRPQGLWCDMEVAKKNKKPKGSNRTHRWVVTGVIWSRDSFTKSLAPSRRSSRGQWYQQLKSIWVIKNQQFVWLELGHYESSAHPFSSAYLKCCSQKVTWRMFVIHWRQ